MKNLLLPLLLCLPAFAFSQVPFKYDIDFALGITSYQGDLDALKVNAGFREIKYSASLSLRRNLTNNYAVRINLLAGQIGGDDRNFSEPEWRIRRGISFESPIIEVSALNEFYPFGMYPVKGKVGRTRNILAPYLLLGVGWAYSSPKVDWNDANGNEEIDPVLADLDKKAKLSKLNVVIPMGFGVRFKLKDHSTFKLETALRPSFSDYLDGISLAGNPNKKDWYFTAQIGVTYPFSKNKNKPKNSIAKQEEKTKKEEKAKPAEKTKKEKPLAGRETPSDIDKDGTPDDDDDCPTDPGLRSLKGCPDRDKDGIADPKDNCPDTPGLAALSGCPDKDKDGVPDDEDECPDTAGDSTNRGCPVADQDKDGVPDADDRCPAVAGLAGLGGCPDKDKDGIADIDDACPETPGLSVQQGCPDQPPPDKAVYFGANKNDWFRTSDETIDEVVEILKKDASLHADIGGHTEENSEGSESGLSDLRAKKVHDYLVSQGIAASRLRYAGYGASRPISEKFMSDDPQLNRQLNRRVEVRFLRR